MVKKHRIVPEGLVFNKTYSLNELTKLGFQHKPTNYSGNLEFFKHTSEEFESLTYLFIYENKGYKLDEIFGIKKKNKI